MTDHPKEHGLLFKPDMVRAYLAGIKSQTRRVITRRNSYVDGSPASKDLWDELQFDRAWVDPGPSPAGNAGPYLKVPRPWIEGGKQVDESVHRVYPRYQVGDLIWGRETWADVNTENGPAFMYRADGALNFCVDDAYPVEYERYPNCSFTMWFSDLWHREERGCKDDHKWRPSIYMPRCAARIVTPIVAVRPERVQDISYGDVIREGVGSLLDEQQTDSEHIHFTIGLFRNLWDSINGEKYPWSNNDWVWPISFKAYEK